MYNFIKIKGLDGMNVGYSVPRMYSLSFNWRLWKYFGYKFMLLLIKDWLAGWTIWYVNNEDDYVQAIETLKKLRKTNIFEFKVLSW